MKYEMQPACPIGGNGSSRVLRVFAKMRALVCVLASESGQDVVEYALVLALIALAATVSLNGIATAIGTAFAAVGSHLTGYTS